MIHISAIFAAGIAAVTGLEGFEGWSQSYVAGHLDANGKYLGGSELMHLVPHGGRLFAALSYWEDSRNCLYASTCGNVLALDQGWAQVIRLDEPNGAWSLDFSLGLWFVQVEALTSVTFTTDSSGDDLLNPVTRLIAASHTSNEATVWIRDDNTGDWERKVIFSNADMGTVRSLTLHRDGVTNVDRVFISLSTIGILSGSWKNGTISWDSSLEIANLPVRPLALAVVNNQLHFSSGKLVYRRSDGAKPAWSVVHDMGGIQPVKALGGIRGLSAIPNPGNEGESLIFAWINSMNHGCMYRLDPDGNGGYTQVLEACLTDAVSAYLGGTTVYSAIAAYNNVLSIKDPFSGSISQLVGFEAHIDCSEATSACTQVGKDNSGYYSGAMFFVRERPGEYALNEIGGKHEAGSPVLVATRTYVESPFAADKGASAMYFGGFDCNNILTTNAAWVYRAEAATVLMPLFRPNRTQLQSSGTVV